MVADIYTKLNGIYTRSDNQTPFSYNDGDDCENYIFEVVNKAQDLRTGSPELQRAIRDWPSFYHFAPQRPDLLRPFTGFLKQKKILEIGSGCGAITRFLGETGADIIALEGSPRRAAITAARCRGLRQVSVVCDSLERYCAAEPVDVIILTGVLEYSNLFMTGDQPDRELLRKTASLLKPGGQIFIAIENKLGLKYWAGAPEDHVGRPFFGLENRYNKQTATTYGREELDRLLKETGFSHREFYYPFPDYKFPSVILREKSLNLPGFQTENLIVPLQDSVQGKFDPAFDTQRVWAEVIRNGLTADLSNSFLVVAGLSAAELLEEDVLGFAYSSSRQPEYAKENRFRIANGVLSVNRERIHPEAPLRPDAAVVQHMDPEEYLPGAIYYLSFLDIISSADWSVDTLCRWVTPYYSLLTGLSQGAADSPWLPGKFLDLSPFNVLIDQDRLRYFDQEWEAAEPVPLKFILFRGLFYCFSRAGHCAPPAENTPSSAFALIREILDRFFPGADDFTENFILLENRYFGNTGMTEDYRPADFNLAVRYRDGEHAGRFHLEPLKTIQVRIFYETDDLGFTEKNSVSRQISLTDKKTVYHIPLQTDRPVRRIRVDPAEQTGLLRVYSISVADKQGNAWASWGPHTDSVAELNNLLALKAGSAPEHYILFLLSDDPMITLTLPRQTMGGQELDIRLELETVEPAAFRELSAELDQVLQLMAFSGHSGKQQPGDQPVFVRQLNRLTHEALKPLTRRLERTTERLAEKTDKLKKLETRLVEAETDGSRWHGENEQLRKDLDWYRRTYENRSFPGLVREGLTRIRRRATWSFLDKLIAHSFFRKRWVASYLLVYARDKGIKSFARAGFDTFREHGIKTITDCRTIVRNKWIRAVAQQNNALRPVPAVAFKAEALMREMEAFRVFPKISVILPSYNTRADLLQMAVDSVQNQLYENWELCLADDGSTNPDTLAVLEALRDEARIKIRRLPANAGISEASNAALAMAGGEYIALLDHDDELTPDALFHIARDINENGEADIIYTDECKVDEQGRLSDHFLKPDWSPELLFNMMYVGHLTVYRKAFLDQRTGGFRKAYDFSQDYDLVLRAVEHTRNIRHIPQVLYHWRMTAGSASQGEKSYARVSNLAALEDAMKRRQVPADIIELPVANRVKIRRAEQPLVSLVIPTDSPENLNDCLLSLLSTTAYPEYEIIVVTNSGLLKAMRDQIASPRLHWLPYDKPYNFSDKCNAGAARASGEIIIFINDDVRPLQADWIENSIEFLFLDGVGAVSPKLLYEDDSIQYAGMAAGVRNLTGTTFHGYGKDSLRYFNFPQLVRNVSILSGACLAIKKDLFIGIGGFNAVDTPSNHSDVDLSFRILEEGLRCVYTPYAVLRHIGHLSLKAHENNQEKTSQDKSDIFLLKRWMHFLHEDPYFTRPMRELLYHDSPEPYQIYPALSAERNGKQGDMLLVSHDLSLTGAPIMLYHSALLLQQRGYYVLVCCPEDGPVRKMYQQAGIDVIVDPLILSRHPSFLKFARNFDYVICNTVVSWPVVAQLQGITKTIWWLQEAAVLEHFLPVPGFIETLEQAHNLITVSDYAQAFIRPYNDGAVKIHNAVADLWTPETEQPRREKIVISIIGSIEPRKGQDVLLRALACVDPRLMEKAEVWIVGRTHDAAYRAELDKIVSPALIRYTGEVNHEQCLEYMRQSDVLVSASRDDPFPVVLVEAFSLAKACIVSSHVGLAELINHAENGLIFDNENAEALGQAIAHLLEDPDRIGAMGRQARKTYEKYLTLDIFRERFLHHLSQVSLWPGQEEWLLAGPAELQHY